MPVSALQEFTKTEGNTDDKIKILSSVGYVIQHLWDYECEYVN